MKKITGSKFTPDFITPPVRDRKKWKIKKIPRGFFKNLQTPRMKAIIDSLDLPENVKKTMDRLEKIDRKNNVLVIDGVLDVGHIICIITHKNAHLVKKISFTQELLTYPEFRSSISDYSEKFESMFGVSPPEEVLEFAYLMDLFRKSYDGKFIYERCPYDLLGMIGSFNYDGFLDKSFFRSYFGYFHFPLGYIPFFTNGESGVSRGFVFDVQHNCFTHFAYHGGGSCSFDKYLWDVIEDVMQCSELHAKSLHDEIDYIFEENEEYEEDEVNLNNCKSRYNYLISSLSGCYENFDKVISWLIHSLITSYFNGVKIKKLINSDYDNLRYEYGLNKRKEKKLTKNYKNFITDDLPHIVIPLENHFHPFFTYDQIHDLCTLIECGKDKFFLERFLSNNYPITNLILKSNSNSYDKISIDDKFSFHFRECVLDFAEKECDEKRYGLALVLAYLFWDRIDAAYSLCDKADEDLDWKNVVARLFSKIPDEYCHPLIRSLAKKHSSSSL